MKNPIQEAAPIILAEIQKAKSILLHLHPSPDPDSVGSALAMKFALEQMGKKATVIRGDSEIPEAFMHFPGAKEIVPKNFFEVDLTEYDLFIIQDTGSLERVSRKGEMKIPSSLPTIDIDHHFSNVGFGTVANLVDISYPSTALILYDLFKAWKLEITPDMAANLFIGTYTDTGGLKFSNVNADTYAAEAELVRIYPKFHELLFHMDNSISPHSLAFEGLALSNIQNFFGNKLALSVVSNESLIEKGINPGDIKGGTVANLLKSVIGWEIGISVVEKEPGKIHLSCRTRNSEKYDLTKLTGIFGGGGHKAAAGGVFMMPLDQAIQKIVETAKTLYNL